MNYARTFVALVIVAMTHGAVAMAAAAAPLPQASTLAALVQPKLDYQAIAAEDADRDRQGLPPR